MPPGENAPGGADGPTVSLPRLSFPPFAPELSRDELGVPFIYDPLRRKWLMLTPEEWVRQSLLNYLRAHLAYPGGLIAQEYPLRVQGMPQRADVVVLDRARRPFLLVECKAPTVPLDSKVLSQVARYNQQLRAAHFSVTNGLSLITFERRGEGYQPVGGTLPPFPA